MSETNSSGEIQNDCASPRMASDGSDSASQANGATKSEASEQPKKLKRSFYETQLKRLHVDLVKLQDWIRHKGLRVVVLFEGRDAAGKGGTIKRITERL